MASDETTKAVLLAMRQEVVIVELRQQVAALGAERDRLREFVAAWDAFMVGKPKIYEDMPDDMLAKRAALG